MHVLLAFIIWTQTVKAFEKILDSDNFHVRHSLDYFCGTHFKASKSNFSHCRLYFLQLNIEEGLNISIVYTIIIYVCIRNVILKECMREFNLLHRQHTIIDVILNNFITL